MFCFLRCYFLLFFSFLLQTNYAVYFILLETNLYRKKALKRNKFYLRKAKSKFYLETNSIFLKKELKFIKKILVYFYSIFKKFYKQLFIKLFVESFTD